MNRHLSICLYISLVAAGLTAVGPAFGQQPLKPRPAIVKPAKATVDPTKHDAVRISVKFRDDLPVRIREGKLAAEGANPNALNAASGLLNRLATAGAKWERQHSVPEEKLNEMRAKAQRNTGKAMADLNTAYILRVPKGMKAEQLIDELNALDAVELAEPMPLPAPLPVAGNYQPQQGYLAVAPAGIDAEYAWTQLAGAGGNVWIADVEYTWNLNHTDLNATLVGPTPVAPVINGVTQTNDHGTAVLGVMGGRNNGVGVTGIVYNSTFFVAGANTATGYDPAAAVTTAAGALREGDVMVLEMQTDGPAAGTTDFVPIEWIQAVYNAIEIAVGNGIIVVAAAGNGSQNLDDAMFNTGHAPFLPANDSGAIIVGAGGVAAASGDRSRVDFSSFGSTVDLQGWGELVVTTGYGSLYSADGTNSFYTSTFNGTSSATPVVAGACAALQAHHKITNFGAVLTPFEVREILRASGSPQLDGIENIFLGTYSQTGTTVTRLGGFRNFVGADINSFIRFSTGQQALITAMISGTQVTVANSQNVAATTINFFRPATQNIGPRPNLGAAMQYVSGLRTWVDFAYFLGSENGSFPRPFNTVPEGYSAVAEEGSLIFKSGTSNWTGTFPNKKMNLRAFGGPVTIGQ